MKKIIYLFIVVLVTFFNQPLVYCQTSYSLQDLALLANKQSETIKIASEDVYLAQLDKKRALSVLMPRATAFGAMTKYKEEDMAAPDTLTMGIKLTQSFTLNGKELIAYDVTKRSIKGKEFSLESIRSQYLLQVSQTYFNILSAQKFLEIAQSDVKRLNSHLNGVKEKLNVGSVTKTDLYRAKAELSKSLTQKVIAENQILQSKAVLQNLIIIDDNFILENSDLKKIDHYECTLDDIQAQALDNRTEIKEAKTNL